MLLKFTLIRGAGGIGLKSILGVTDYDGIRTAWLWLWDRYKDSEAQLVIESFLSRSTSLLHSWNLPWFAIASWG